MKSHVRALKPLGLPRPAMAKLVNSHKQHYASAPCKGTRLRHPSSYFSTDNPPSPHPVRSSLGPVQTMYSEGIGKLAIKSCPLNHPSTIPNAPSPYVIPGPHLLPARVGIVRSPFWDPPTACPPPAICFLALLSANRPSSQSASTPLRPVSLLPLTRQDCGPRPNMFGVDDTAPKLVSIVLLP